MRDTPEDAIAADTIAAEQARQNLTTRNQWQLYASHRKEIEKLIAPEARGGRLCVLGAGNCNDLDLKWLVEAYREVHLVDLDPEALRGGIERQGVKREGGEIHCHAPVDLTGIAGDVAGWEKTVPRVEQIEAVTRRLVERPTYPWGLFDVVLSPCVLTQMIKPVRDALREKYPPSHRARVGIMAALRARHLRTIAGMLAPGGRGVVLVDLISSEKFADLARLRREELGGFMRKFIADGKHYSGLDPASMARAVETDGELAGRLRRPEFTEPWLWHIGLNKAFLVYGVSVRGRGED
jgi:hypothetical protein